MPTLPSEENHSEPRGSLTDKVAKESSDSTASDHPIHDKAQAHHHQGKGPQISDNIPTTAEGSKEELQAKAKELNK
ncbi:hypothetical protein LTR84_001229 [Exophiala bonariae]|uniref:Uncharacterized protein n=1 Tax=Exophiala bonariae TaxID=1690606 RepID=A0AAV9NST4_9EURO|nr:hypothetical protein LTR84_001229 [Exophiala bonariae]